MRRGSMAVVYDILKAIGLDGCVYTHIIYKANLGGSMIPRYLIPLMNSDLLIKNGNHYKLSAKGSLALDHGSKFVKICDIYMKPEGEIYGYKPR